MQYKSIVGQVSLTFIERSTVLLAIHCFNPRSFLHFENTFNGDARRIGLRVETKIFDHFAQLHQTHSRPRTLDNRCISVERCSLVSWILVMYFKMVW